MEALAWDGGFVLRQIRDIRAIAFARSSQNMFSVSLGRAAAHVPTLGCKLQHTARMGAHANCMRDNRRPIQALLGRSKKCTLPTMRDGPSVKSRNCWLAAINARSHEQGRTRHARNCRRALGVEKDDAFVGTLSIALSAGPRCQLLALSVHLLPCFSFDPLQRGSAAFCTSVVSGAARQVIHGGQVRYGQDAARIVAEAWCVVGLLFSPLALQEFQEI